MSDNFVSSARLHSSDVSFAQVMKWMDDNGVNTDSRIFNVTSKLNLNSGAARRRSLYRNPMNSPEEDEFETEADDFGPKHKYDPAPGISHPFIC